MQKLRVPINSFRFGEISESTRMRADTDLYLASAQSIENMLVTTEGALVKRPDLKHVYKYTGINDPALGGQSHLFHFIFDEGERYVISVEHQQIRCFFLDDDGVYGDAGELVLVETITQDTNTDPLPFDRDYLHQYTATQSGDVMIICHPLFMPRMLIRTALDAFEVTPYTFDVRADAGETYQPYSRFHGQGVTLDPNGTTGQISVTTSEDYFTTDHTGVTLKYGDVEMDIDVVWTSKNVSATVNGELKIRLETLNPLRTIDGSTTVEVTHIAHGFSGGESITIENAAATGGINTGNLNGTRTVGTIIDGNTYTFTAGGSASSAEDGGGYVSIVSHAATDNWSEQSFSAVRGYPAAATFHENRLVFGGTIAQPDTLWFSTIGKFFNFDVGTGLDDESFDLTASTGDVNTVRYLISNRDLQVFTDSAELYVPAYLNQAITPTNAQMRKQTPYGCEFTYPHPFDGATLFIQAGGNVMREYLYTDNEAAYTSSSISSAASHLIVDPKCLGVANGAFGRSESYAFMSTGDGNMSMFNSNRAERRAAWTHFTTNGSFCSVLGVGSRIFANVWGPDNQLYLIELDGEYSLDFRMAASGDAGFAGVMVDIGLFPAGTDVALYGNDNDGTITYLGEHTVVAEAGSATHDKIPYSALASQHDSYTVGFPFYASVTTNPIDASMGNGPATGMIRGIGSVIADVLDTENFQVNGRPSMLTEPFSGKREVRTNTFSRDPQVTISQNQPSPIQINGLIVELVV